MSEEINGKALCCARSKQVMPYLASVGMMRRWLQARLAGAEEEEAWLAAMSGEKPRAWSRREIAGAHGQGPVMLSVPIEGGSSVVKRGRPEGWRLSGHGRWQQMHLGSIEAAYGATPFFEHLYPSLRAIILDAREGDSFVAFASSIHKALAESVDLDESISYLRNRTPEEIAHILLLAKEKTEKGYAERAFLDVIFRRGRESIFTLLSSR